MNLDKPMDSYTQRQSLIEQLVDSCVQLGVTDFVLSPGSRSAPLTAALAQHPALRMQLVIDERSAGYVALGIAQQTRQVVGVVTTSGTAAANLAPAIIEAFYQHIPLLILTADRPPEWIDQQDNQAIRQQRLYEPHVLGEFDLPVDVTHPDAQWHARRLLAQAIHLAQGFRPGPVHLNVPLREPLYPALSPPNAGQATPLPSSPTRQMTTHPQLSESAWDELLALWQQSKRKLLVAGMYRLDARLHSALQRLAQRRDVALIADITANLYPAVTPLLHSDMIAGTRDSAVQAALTPDLLISFGGPLVSKYIKQLVRNAPVRSLWHVQAGAPAPDTFQRLTHAIPAEPGYFFEELEYRIRDIDANYDYTKIWRCLEQQAQAQLTDFLQKAPFGEFKAMQQVLAALPADSRLQLGNSMIIRYANFIAHLPNMGQSSVHSNRGASGIDGCVSTALGAALTTDQLTTLLIGDLAFFYDRNGLWQRRIPTNLRIVIFNNHGGGIFDIIEGPNRLPQTTQKDFFLTPHPLTAKRTAEDYQLDYFQAGHEDELGALLPAFFAARPRAAILEITSEMATNSQVFQQFRSLVAALHC